ncbi:mitochondrial carrier [Clavulina sp. PMI_390]|nr:mitochondrial carrier [Clavulina sp. PMI_390]
MSKHLLAGATSGLISAVSLQPLDLIKTRLQQQQRITPVTGIVRGILNNEGGLAALWRGTLPTVIRNVPGVALYFYCLQGMRSSMATMPMFSVQAPPSSSRLSVLPKLSPTGNLLAGAVARVSVGFVLNPFTLLKARFESDLYRNQSIWKGLKDVVEAHGARGLLQGFTASAIRDAPYSGIFVLSYELFKQHASESPKMPHYLIFYIGAAAATVSTLVTQPFDVAKTNMQVHPRQYTSVSQTFISLAKQERGMQAYFDGLSFRLVKKGFSSAISWAVYEMFLRYLTK